MRSRIRPRSSAVERLLDADIADGTALSRVLAAARAPGRPHEVAGLDAARSAFMRAGPASSRPPARSRATATRTAAGRFLALKVISAVGGATLVGGASYAASSTGLLGGGSDNHPARHAPASGPASAWNPLDPTSGLSAGAGAASDHPSPTASAHNSPGKSTAASARDSHNPAPASTASTHRPSSTPTPTPTGHARTTPPTRPSDPAGTHTVPTTPPPGGRP
jgi:hypothetical protein